MMPMTTRGQRPDLFAIGHTFNGGAAARQRVSTPS